MERYICIHGHFYQPARENPWLESIEPQESAQPYHDWNEKITAECYAPNAAARILGRPGQISKTVNNYAKLSFNFGPTLLSWLEKKRPNVYRKILEADRESQTLFSGHGSALAQVYNHIIMPLANRPDKYTQVLWGMRDFQDRFGRMPEGMWLPETAVDLETLEILAELGVKFTILSPHQARQMRKISEQNWSEVVNGEIDTKRAYRCELSSGQKIDIFFYNASISHAVAFEHLLNSGEGFAKRLISAFSDSVRCPQLVNVATDGETYGHHHRFGEMALAYALDYIESNSLARITNYGEYLEKNPAAYEVEIKENTSWSCVHGVERWQKDCGCNSGAHPGWNQKWRKPLRQALDWLRGRLTALYENKTKEFLRDPWGARNEYIEVVLDRSPENVERFLSQRAVGRLNQKEKTTALKLLEIQRQAMLMYSSCGWFSDDISGIESAQILRHAGRAIELAEEVGGPQLERQFLETLKLADSNIGKQINGARIYQESVKSAAVDLKRVCAHYAITSLFKKCSEQQKIHCCLINREEYDRAESEQSKLAIGQVQITSEITWETARFCFGAAQLGRDNIICGVSQYTGLEEYNKLKAQATRLFHKGNLSGVCRILEEYFRKLPYSLESLLPEE